MFGNYGTEILSKMENMMKKLNLLFIPIIFSILVNSCNDSSMLTNYFSSEKSVSNVKDKSIITTSEFGEVKSFDINVKTIGTLKPREPLNIEFDLLSNVNTEIAEVKIILPEIAALRKAEQQLGNRQLIPLALGVPIPPEYSVIKSFVEGESLNKSITLKVEEPGYYMVVAVTRSQSERNLTKNGKVIDKTIRREFWLWIDENGGQITDIFDANLFSEGYHKIPGPLTPVSESPRIRLVYPDSGLKNKANGNSAQITSSHDVTIAFTYMDPKTDVLQPVTAAPVYVTITDEFENRVISESWDQTDSEGKIYKTCDETGYESIQADLYTTHSTVDVSYEGSTIAATESTSLVACGYTFESRATSSQVYVWYEMPEIINNSRSYFSHSRGKVALNIDADAGSYYSPSSDRIVILESHADGSSFGDFVLAHEYAHAFHEKGLGGMKPEVIVQVHIT